MTVCHQIVRLMFNTVNVIFNSFERNHVHSVGIGSSLLKKIIGISKTEGCRRIFLITTNDNIDSLKFYQKNGMTIKGIYCDSIKDERRLKPEIPLTGNYGIPIRDEIEIEIAF